MLRLPDFEVARPNSVSRAVEILEEHAPSVMVIAGGTDLVPNMKHELFTPKLLVSLGEIDELRGIQQDEDGTLRIGAMTPLSQVASSELVQRAAPALAQATSLVAGPQLRTMGTLGGNVLLDTRCQWYNQTYFWRQSLGFCMKKDGTECHVVKGGSKCVAAASNDSAPTLMSVGAKLLIEGPQGRYETAIDDFWVADGIVNKKLGPADVLVEIRVPRQAAGHRGAYGKLRDRGSIDYPLLGLAVRLDLDGDGAVEDADLVAVALQARPSRVRGIAEVLRGTRPGTEAFDTAVNDAAELAYKRCHPMPNVPGDHDWRREMVPVYARRTLHAAADGTGPVHHI